ncbi:MAG: FtsX-like permease family protein, partial [Bacteroidota bacterium]
YIFAIIGFIILLTAGLNYINLSTALISKRVKEIGVKKVVGASFQSLFYQMLTETFLLSIIAFVAGLGIVQLMLPSLRTFVDIPLTLDFTKPTIWLVLVGVIALSIAIAGIYPALMTANFKPIQLIRGNEKAEKGVTLRKILVVTQFTSVIIVLISTFVIYQQLQYIQYKDVGYDRSQVMLIRPHLFRTGDWRQNFDNYVVYKEELSKLPQFTSVAMTDNPISNINNRNSGGFQWEGQAADQSVNVAQFRVNQDLQDLFGLEMEQGRWFDAELQTDRNNVILNETAIKQFGIKEPVIGTKTTFQQREGTIIGVVKDFNYSSLREKIEPLVIWHNDGRGTNILARVEGENINEAIQVAEAKFNEILPGLQFEYQFIDEAFQKMHTADIKMSQLFKVFTGILVFISCLGLLGLAVFAADRRVKEIGVRKVLGASIGNIVSLLSKDFLKLVLVSFVIAVPVGWYFMKEWLNNFAYSSPLYWWIFALAGFLAISIAFLTVSTQSIKAAVANPVQSLRND